MYMACSYLLILNCSISAAVVLLLSRCDSNEMVVYHKASRSLCRFDHTPQSRSYPMFDRRTRADSESGFVGLFQVR